MFDTSLTQLPFILSCNRKKQEKKIKAMVNHALQNLIFRIMSLVKDGGKMISSFQPFYRHLRESFSFQLVV